MYNKNLASYSHIRNLVIPSFESHESDDPYALFIIVNDDKSTPIALEADIHQAVTYALLELFSSEKESSKVAVGSWLTGRIRKIVKRARNKAWDEVTALPGSLVVKFGTATIAVIPPMPLSEQPQALRKLQVAGLQLATSSTPSTDTVSLDVTVDASLNMSYGKTVAQVAHVTQLFLMYGLESRVQSWLESGCKVLVDYSDKLEDETYYDVFVRDAGFTEVAPGSLTAAGNFTG